MYRVLMCCVAGVVGYFVLACNQNIIKTPVRSFDRPTDVALTCVQYDPVAVLFGPRPLTDCDPAHTTALTITDSAGIEYQPRLRALVTNSARGELAEADINTSDIIDLDRRVPGYGFLPIGKLPLHVRASSDGCVAVTANYDSCDLSRVRLDTLNNMPFETVMDGGASFGEDVERRVIPMAGGVPLGARPTYIELATESVSAVGPFSPNGTPGICVGGNYRVWATFPSCGLVAELQIDDNNVLADGTTGAEVVRAVHLNADGSATTIADPTQIRCAAECVGDDPSPVLDGGVSAINGQPVALAMVVDGSGTRMMIADRQSERLTIVALDTATGVPGEIRQIALETGAVGLTGVKVSPRTPAGRFAYLIARDNTVRVVDIDRERECDTNVDGRFFSGIPLGDPNLGAARLGCFPVGDPATPPRSPNVVGPGINFPATTIPTDVTFVHLNIPAPLDNVNPPFQAAPTFIVGDFAWVSTTDGRAAIVQIFDACPPPNVPQASGAYYFAACSQDNVLQSRIDAFSYVGNPVPVEADRLSHQIRNGSNRFFQTTSVLDTTGAPRLQDPSIRYTLTVAGVSAAETVLPNGTTTHTLPRLVNVNTPKPPYITSTDPLDESIRFPNPRAPDAETWVAAWEGIMPLTGRFLGRPLPGGAFRDSGAAFCQRGVRAGDKLDIIGCASDVDCDRSQSCVRDPSAPTTVVNGLCLDSTNETQDIAKLCAPLLTATRRYRILSAKQDVPQPTGETTDDLILDEIDEPEYATQTHTCSADADCADVLVASTNTLGNSVDLPTHCLADAVGQKTCIRSCDSSKNDTLCGLGYLCTKSSRSDGGERCMRAPLDDTLNATCLKQLQHYQIRAGDAFLVNGSTSGAPNQVRVDPTTHECFEAPVVDQQTRLLRPRIPLVPPVDCPADFVDALSPLPTDMTPAGMANVCRYPSPTNDELIVHYENPQFTIALGVPAAGTQVQVPLDDTVLSFIVVAGAFPFTIGLTRSVSGEQALLPRSMVTAPDQSTVFIVDEGKSSAATGLRGQLLMLLSPAQQIESRFIVR